MIDAAIRIRIRVISGFFLGDKFVRQGGVEAQFDKSYALMPCDATRSCELSALLSNSTPSKISIYISGKPESLFWKHFADANEFSKNLELVKFPET